MARGVSILATGSEILDGRVLDTNSNYICASLAARGINVRQILSCDDQEQSIIEAISFLLARSEMLLISGGLGPTSDDRTREAVAAYSGRRLIQNDGVLAALQERYRSRNRHFDPLNTKQALFPENSTIVENPTGTAAGFITVVKRPGAQPRHIMALPGVPSELKRMYEATALPYLLWELGSDQQINRRVLRVCGIPEADLGSRIEALNLAPEITVSYRASFPEIQLVFKTIGDEGLLVEALERARAAIGAENIFSESLELDYASALLERLASRGMTLAVGDYGGGGEMACLLLGAGRRGEVFKGATVHGPRLRPCGGSGGRAGEEAIDLARRVREQFGAEIGLALVAPGGPGAEIPLVDYFVGLVTPAGEEAFPYQFGSNPDLYVRLVSWRALETLRRALG